MLSPTALSLAKVTCLPEISSTYTQPQMQESMPSSVRDGVLPDAY